MSPQYEFFSGFAWAIPKAFSDALNACLFEEGDMLYESKTAYEGVTENPAIQVRFPERKSGGTATEFGVFDSNWGSSIKVEVYRNGILGSTEFLNSTQGRLYMALWHGDLDYLTAEEDPLPPKRLKSANTLFRHATDEAKRHGKGKPVFVMPYDAVNPVSKQKLYQLQTAFKKDVDLRLLSLKEAGIPGWETIAPTSQTAIFIAKHLSEAELISRIKRAVYKPLPTAKTDQFRLSAHGFIA
jgi:hypothetical protein